MYILSFILLLQLSAGNSVSCPIKSSFSGITKPLYLLTLVPYTKNVGLLSGARIARDEINNRTDLLSGYHLELITARRESCTPSFGTIGLTNLLKYTIDPPCRPVVAVNGLGCSSHTEVMSLVASNDQIEIIQLSAANSAIFQTESHRFPHLWTFLGSATAYCDATLALMNRFNWTRVGVVYNSGSGFSTENAKYLEQKIKSTNHKSIIFKLGVRGTSLIYFDRIIKSIKAQEVTILVVMLNSKQDATLLSYALAEGLVYPQYTWIHFERTPQWLVNINVLNRTLLYRGIHGHLFLFPFTQKKLIKKQPVRLVSNEHYSDLIKKFNEDLKKLNMIFNRTNTVLHLTFGSYLYDQVWSLALALNRSLPILEKRNLSIDNYGIGQHSITAIIEEQMANLSFQGAGGWVNFNQYRSVSTPVDIIWVLDKNGTQEHVGVYNPLLSGNSLHVELNASSTISLPKDSLDKEFALIPFYMTILIYSLIGVVTIITTVQLVLYFYHREHRMIKASSPGDLSLLMFAGCYFLLLASINRITYASFFNVITQQGFIALWCVNIVATLNGLCLILVTLCIKLLRVYRIFSSKLQTVILGQFSSVCHNTLPKYVLWYYHLRSCCF